MSKGNKIIGGNREFRKNILKALRILAAPVKQTLGPDGLSILIDRGDQSPLSTKDGVTVANAVQCPNPVLNLMIQAMKETAQKTNELAGDGTTTAIVLTESIIKESLKFIDSGHISPQKLATELNSLKPEVIKYLEKMTKTIKTDEDAINVARISSNGDEDVAQKVFEAIDASGKDGFISLEDGWSTGIEIERVDGFTVDNGWNNHMAYGQRFIKDRVKQETDFEDVSVVLYDGPLKSYGDVSQLLMSMAGGGRTENPTLPNTVIVAHSFSGEVRDMLSKQVSMNSLNLPILLVETAIMGTPNSKLHCLDDLSVLTGAKIIPHGDMTKVILASQEVDPVYVGKCGRVIQTKNRTTFFEGGGGAEMMEKHIQIIKKQMADMPSEFDKGIYRARLGRLVGGIVILRIGGTTDLEIKERKDRVEDSLNATRGAILEGILPGGGTALLRVSSYLKKKFKSGNLAATILADALEYPIKQIATNCGESPDVISATVKKHFASKPNYGFDAYNRVFIKDMFKAGIIDPLRVVKTGFINALSIAIEILKGGGYCVIGDSSNKNLDNGMGSMLDSLQNEQLLPGDNPDDIE